jgi:hypothetical protein
MLPPIATRLNPMDGPRFDLSALHAQVVASKVNSRAMSERNQVAGVDKQSSQAMSRLDGLRNLVTVLRQKQVKTTEVPHEPAPASAAAFMAAASPELVTAKLESLRPKLVVDPSAAEESAENAASDRPNRSVRFEEVAIRPSRPGQYKRK